MNTTKSSSDSSRRDFLQRTAAATAAVSVATQAIPKAHARGQEKPIQIGLVGCGGRGTGAAANAMNVPSEQLKLVAMADVFEDRLTNSLKGLAEQFPMQVQVPEDHRYVDFDGYKSVMDRLDPGDIVILATPPAFRWLHFRYAIERGLHVFMEKPVTVDGPTSRKMLELARMSEEKNLKVGVGLMCRHCRSRQELFERIRNDEIGEVMLLRAYRMTGPTGFAASGPKPNDMSDLMYQIQRFHSFLWLSGGAYSDFLIHNIDECCWMKDAWPVEAKASGGRHYRGDSVDQNFDTYSVEYTFADGTKLNLDGRTIPGCHQEFASYAHGTKGMAVISTSGHAPSKCRIYSGQKPIRRNLTWQCPTKEPNPYQLEWNDLVDAIRNDRAYNEVERGVIASVVTSMGRMAAHTGQVVTYDDMLNCDHEFAPSLESLTFDAPSPLPADADGNYAIPKPGLLTDYEYDWRG